MCSTLAANLKRVIGIIYVLYCTLKKRQENFEGVDKLAIVPLLSREFIPSKAPVLCNVSFRKKAQKRAHFFVINYQFWDIDPSSFDLPAVALSTST